MSVEWKVALVLKEIGAHQGADTYTLWSSDIAVENGQEIVDLPIVENGDFPDTARYLQ